MSVIHWFDLECLTDAYDSDTIEQWITDDSDKRGDKSRLRRLHYARDFAEKYCKDRIKLRYDPSQWDVDTDGDGISDNIDAVLVDCAVSITLHRLAGRRSEIPQSIKDGFDNAEMKLERIASGAMQLGGSDTAVASNLRVISGNMEESDLENLTSGGGTSDLPWSEIL